MCLNEKKILQQWGTPAIKLWGTLFSDNPILPSGYVKIAIEHGDL